MKLRIVDYIRENITDYELSTVSQLVTAMHELQCSVVRLCGVFHEVMGPEPLRFKVSDMMQLIATVRAEKQMTMFAKDVQQCTSSIGIANCYLACLCELTFFY